MANPSTLAESLIATCCDRGLKIVVAESCTAGRLATILAAVEGAGECFLGGFVVYAKEQKVTALGVPSELIAEHTAVSRPVAEAMAAGALHRSPADVSIAVTGVAGPRPDDDGNPVGLMYVALSYNGHDSTVRQFRFDADDPESLCERVCAAALALALERLSTRERTAI